MDVRTEATIATEEATTAAEPDERLVNADEVLTRVTPPGIHDSFVLAMDYLLTLSRLFKAEASLALSALPLFVALNITRLPVYLLTWISFAVLVATGVYVLTGSPLLTAAAFFILQLALTFLLERQLRKAREACSLPETRRSMTEAVAGIKERFKDEQSHP